MMVGANSNHGRCRSAALSEAEVFAPATIGSLLHHNFTRINRTIEDYIDNKYPRC